MNQPDVSADVPAARVHPVAFLDACVLFPASLRDALLIAGEHPLYDPLWSDDVLLEIERNLVGKQKTTLTQVKRLTQTMREAFPAATVAAEAYASLIERMTNDPKDRHVTAAAIAGGASLIVTFNIADFPVDALEQHGLRAVTPDGFFMDLLAEYPDTLADLFRQQASILRNPPKSYTELLATLAQHIPLCVECLQQQP